MRAIWGGCLVAVLTGAAADAASLAPHRAHYKLSLHESSADAGMQAVDGLLIVEVANECSGFVSNQELAFVGQLDAGPAFSYGVRFSSWESPEQDQLRFTVRSYDNGELFEEYRGSARLGGGGATASYELPSSLELELPADTVFPTAHMQRLVDAASKGDLIVRSNVFDGSGPDALTSVTAVIGRAETVAVTQGALAGEASWPVSLAYYPLGEESELPSFEIAFNMTGDGILSDIVLDYGDFALAGVLTELERYQNPVCD